jgi:hypothetical protein
MAQLGAGRVSELLSALGLWSLPPPPAPAPPPSLAAQLVAAASAPWAAHLALLPLLAAGMVALALQRGGRTRKRAPAVSARCGSGEPLTVFYASQKGHAKRFAERLVARAHEHGQPATAVDVAGFDTDRLVQHGRAVFVVATYAGGSAVPGTEFFFSELSEVRVRVRLRLRLRLRLRVRVWVRVRVRFRARVRVRVRVS